jgi:hypothetical protein
MDIVSIVVALLAFNAGFLFGAFWVSAKNNDAKDAERKHAARLARG